MQRWRNSGDDPSVMEMRLPRIKCLVHWAYGNSREDLLEWARTQKMTVWDGVCLYIDTCFYRWEEMPESAVQCPLHVTLLIWEQEIPRCRKKRGCPLGNHASQEPWRALPPNREHHQNPQLSRLSGWVTSPRRLAYSSRAEGRRSQRLRIGGSRFRRCSRLAP